MGGAMVGRGVTQGTGEIDLNAYLWRNRLLLVFAPSEDHTRYRDLIRELRDKEEKVIDRDLLVFHVLERGESRLDNSSIDGKTAARLRKRFSAKLDELTVVLVGKDGGEKLRRGNEVDMAEFFSLIDSMPMRQREMRERRREKTR
jgi:glycerate kinase